MAIIDVITYNGESELFDLRYNILKDVVDQFIVVEFDKTFSGKPKEPTFDKHYDKVKYYFIPESIYGEYKDLAEGSPNTVGADHWKTEFMQKESIKDCLTHLKDDDVVFIGDCDEIWDPTITHEFGKLNLRVYTYYLNNRSTEQFHGTICLPYLYVRQECLNHLRTNSVKRGYLAGWHFTSLKGTLRKKLEDSYTKETYANDWVMNNLDDNVQKGKDFLGRDFTFTVDESEWPEYLKQNKEMYQNMCKSD